MPSDDPANAGARLARVAERLERLTGKFEPAHDSRCVFTYAYAIMTWRISSGLRQRPDLDSAWVASLAESFAQRYFNAIEEFDRGESNSEAWRVVFTALRDRRTSVLEDLVFAMTAHIIHDLPLALGDVSPAGTIDVAHIHEYHAVNDMMESAVELVQDEVGRRYDRGIGWLDRMTEGYDEIVSNYGFRMSRGLAWYNAHRLNDARARPEALEAIEKSPILVVTNVLDPPIMSLRIVARFLRLISRLARRWPTTDPTEAVRAAGSSPSPKTR